MISSLVFLSSFLQVPLYRAGLPVEYLQVPVYRAELSGHGYPGQAELGPRSGPWAEHL